MLLGEPLDGAGKRLSGRGHSAGQVRDLAWTRPSEAFSRLSPESRRSQGSLPQHVFGLIHTNGKCKVGLVDGSERFHTQKRRNGV